MSEEKTENSEAVVVTKNNANTMTNKNDKGASRVGEDYAGGLIIEAKAPTVFVNKKNITVIGAAVAGHGDGIHAAPVMAEASETVFAEKQNVCRLGDAASCGHTTTGSENVFIGD